MRKLQGLALIGALVVLCAGCNLTGNVLDDKPMITSVTSGLTRGQDGIIKDTKTTFSPSDRSIVFNASIENVTQETAITAFWYFGDNHEPFTSYTVQAKPGLTLAKFSLEKASDWPSGVYHIEVHAGNGADANVQRMEFRVL
jgi:hypothetical protein